MGKKHAGADVGASAQDPTEMDADLENISNEGDRIMNAAVTENANQKIEDQRLLDEQADIIDSTPKKNKEAETAERTKAAQKAEAEKRGPVAIGGQVINDEPAPEMRLTKDKDGNAAPADYENFPIKKIDGKDVRFVGSVPSWNKTVDWDDGFRDKYQHFTQCKHPLYHNASYVAVKFKHPQPDLNGRAAYVVRTNQYTELYIERGKGI